MKTKKIVFFHLWNNFTGSTKVLHDVIEGLSAKGYKVELVTNKTEGFLSNFSDIDISYKYIHYNWSNNKFKTLLYFIIAQIELFIVSLGLKNKIVYINTLLPFSAACGAKLRGNEVVYHVHEKFLNNSYLNRLLLYSYQNTALKSIFVSNYLCNCYPEIKSSSVIYNSLDNEFYRRAEIYLENRSIEPNTILLVASLRKYKGINIFLELSERNPIYNFELVLSCTEIELQKFIKQNNIPSNLTLFNSQTDIHPFLQRAKIVLNLSLVNECIETFGLTILEAMIYGIPTIVPPIGGPLELVTDDLNGFLVDSNNIKLLDEKISILMKNDDLYNKLSANALKKSKVFSHTKMTSEIEKYLSKTI